MKKLLLSLIFTICTLQLWAYDFEVDGIYYTILSLQDKTAEVSRDDINFQHYKQEEIVIPETVNYNGKNYTVVSLGWSAFAGSKRLKKVILPSSLLFIESDAFSKCDSLYSLIIPKSVIRINPLTNNSFKELVVEEGNQIYDSRDNCNAVIETKTNTLIVGCKNTIIPQSVTIIGTFSFSALTIDNLTIPKSVMECQNYAFEHSSIKQLVIEDSQEELTLGRATYSSISWAVIVGFASTKIDTLYLGRNLNYERCTSSPMDDSGYYSCFTSLNYVTFGRGITEIPPKMFYSTDIKDIRIPFNIRNICRYSFMKCKNIKNIVLEDTWSPLEFGKETFYDCGNTPYDSIILKRPIVYYDNWFPFTPSSVDYMFISIHYGIPLYKLYWPVTLKYIKEIHVDTDLPPMISNYAYVNKSFYEKSALYVPDGCKEIYENHDCWFRFANIYEESSTGINLINESPSLNKQPLYDLNGIETKKPESKTIYINSNKKYIYLE